MITWTLFLGSSVISVNQSAMAVEGGALVRWVPWLEPVDASWWRVEESGCCIAMIEWYEAMGQAINQA